VNLTIPNQGIKVDKEKREIFIPSLKLTSNYNFRNNFNKINQIELGKQYAHVNISIPEKPMLAKVVIGLDRNTTRHIVVTATLQTRKVGSLGRKLKIYIRNTGKLPTLGIY